MRIGGALGFLYQQHPDFFLDRIEGFPENTTFIMLWQSNNDRTHGFRQFTYAELEEFYLTNSANITPLWLYATGIHGRTLYRSVSLDI